MSMTIEATEMHWKGTLHMRIKGKLGDQQGGILDGVRTTVSGVDLDQAVLLGDALRKGLTLTTAEYKVDCQFTAVLTF